MYWLLDSLACAARREPGPVTRLLRGNPDGLRLGRRMSALYRSWQNRNGPELASLTRLLLEEAGLPPGTPLARACLHAAAAVSSWGGFPYHSALHHAEVATNAMVLAALSHEAPLQAEERQILLTAALGHDLYWEPTGSAPFEREAQSARLLCNLCSLQGVSGTDRAAVGALVMGTEPKIRQWLRQALANGAPPALPAPLAPLAEGRLLRLAALLSDADLLSSAGLTPAWTRVQQARLEREQGRALGRPDLRQFLDTVVGPDFLTPAGRVFSPNLARIRAALG